MTTTKTTPVTATENALTLLHAYPESLPLFIQALEVVSSVLGLNSTQMGQALGVHRWTVQRWKRGLSTPNAETRWEVAKKMAQKCGHKDLATGFQKLKKFGPVQPLAFSNPVTNMLNMIQTALVPAVSLIKDVTTWENAARRLIENKIKRNQCFSSGELTLVIRTERPDLRFSHKALGEYVRELHEDGEYSYDNGLMETATRTTLGKGSTPAGTRVIVYGPTYNDCMTYDFEVAVPSGRVSN